MTESYEVNFDGLVGPTHNYAGLAYGNVASTSNTGIDSSPRQAALQGLEKMRLLASWGLRQAVLPPQPRPATNVLRALGFEGSDDEVIRRAHQSDPVLLASCNSASSMWSANSATVSPSPDCGDGRLHFTVANLSGGIHRWIEAQQTYRVLSSIFNAQDQFCVHEPLPHAAHYSDEGAANHTRLCADFGGPGVELFVFGRDSLDATSVQSSRFSGRQSRLASEAIVRRHGLNPSATVIAQQHPAAIDAGVFHNDVISVGHRGFLLVHELAYVNCPKVLDELRQKFKFVTGEELIITLVGEEQLTLQNAVRSYLFNSQIVTRDDGTTVMVCPTECQEIESARRTVEWIVAQNNLIGEAQFIDLRQSMRNGGGPACLRLRVAITASQLASIHPGILFDESLDAQLSAWVNQHYRDSLTPSDLGDPSLGHESDAALRDLASILDLPNTLFN